MNVVVLYEGVSNVSEKLMIIISFTTSQIRHTLQVPLCHGGVLLRSLRFIKFILQYIITNVSGSSVGRSFRSIPNVRNVRNTSKPNHIIRKYYTGKRRTYRLVYSNNISF